MFDEYTYHYDKYDKIEEYDDKDGCQEGTKKCCCVGKEAAGGKNANKSHLLLSIAASAPYVLLNTNVVYLLYCAFSNLQSSTIVFSCRPLYYKVISDNIWEVYS